MEQPTLKEQVVSYREAIGMIKANPKQANAIRRGLGAAPMETLEEALRRRGRIIQAKPATVAVVGFDWDAYDKAVARTKQAKVQPRKKLSRVRSKTTRKSR